MSANFNRAKYNKAQSSKHYKCLMIQEFYPPYWDDGVVFPTKGWMLMYQYRSYRTWKHSRKNQRKDE